MEMCNNITLVLNKTIVCYSSHRSTNEHNYNKAFGLTEIAPVQVSVTVSPLMISTLRTCLSDSKSEGGSLVCVVTALGWVLGTDRIGVSLKAVTEIPQKSIQELTSLSV